MDATGRDCFPLDGLLQCGQCGEKLRLESGPEARYVCPGLAGQAMPCGVPALDAGELNRLLTGEITRRVITPTMARQFREQWGGELSEGPGGPDTDLSEEGVRIVAAGALWLQAREGMAMLGSFVERIEVRAGTATVRYSLPLPPGTPLAGATHQTVSLPGTALA